TETSPSFPSGHAVGPAMFFGMLSYILICTTRRLGWSLVPLWIVLIALLGFSRLYLGVHWFSDVIGGWLFGFGWAALWIAAAELMRRHPTSPAMGPPASSPPAASGA